MATMNLDLFTQVKRSYTDALKDAGISFQVSSATVRAAREMIADNPANAHSGNGFIAAGDWGDMLAVVAYKVMTSAEKADKAIHDIAIMLAVTEEQEVWKHVLAPNGKPYRRFSSFARDAMPQLSESTVRNYLAVARDVYLPIVRNELKGFEFLENVPAGTLSLVKSGIVDEEVRGAFLEELTERRSNKLDVEIGKWNLSDPVTRGPAPTLDNVSLSARELQAALKDARNTVGAYVKEVDLSPKVDPEQLKADLEGANDVPVESKAEDVNAALVKRVKSLFEGDDAVISAVKNDVEIHVCIDADAKRSVVDALSKAAVNGVAAMELANQLLKLIK